MKEQASNAFPARLAFEEMPLPARKAAIDDLFADLDPDVVRAAVREPQCLGIVVEAMLMGLPEPEDLIPFVGRYEINRLGELVMETLLARLPDPKG